MNAELEACLPPELRGVGARITPIAAGLSGAGVYRVETESGAWVLKIASAQDPVDGWRVRAEILRSAAEAGVAPRLVHVDESRRAVVTELVADRTFMARFFSPATRSATIEQLASALRSLHALPIPPGSTAREPRAFLSEVWARLAGFPLPAWSVEAIQRVLDEAPPPPDRAPVLSHNDVNPTNLVHDGARVLFLDWDSAGPNDPLYDLATVAVFLRMDDASCAQLIAAHDSPAPVAPISVRFRYLRRLIAALCGTLFLHVARTGGHPGARGDETLELAPSLGGGSFNARTPEGQWQFGQALLEASGHQFA